MIHDITHRSVQSVTATLKYIHAVLPPPPSGDRRLAWKTFPASITIARPAAQSYSLARTVENKDAQQQILPHRGMRLVESNNRNLSIFITKTQSVSMQRLHPQARRYQQHSTWNAAIPLLLSLSLFFSFIDFLSTSFNQGQR